MHRVGADRVRGAALSGTLCSVTDLRADGLRVFRELLPGLLPDDDADVEFADGFAPELMDIGMQTVFGALWTRPGLAKRDRSLVTWAS